MKYVYFVSYAHERGWGNIEITSSASLDSIQAIHSTQDTIRDASGMRGIVIASFQLLRTESDDAQPNGE